MKKFGYSAFQPIFVVGNSRSGTTLMGRILDLSDSIFTFHELHFFEQLWSVGAESKVLRDSEAVKLCSKLLSIEREGYLAKRLPEKYDKEAAIIIYQAKGEKLKLSEVFHLFLQNEVEKNGKQRPCDQTPRNVLYIEEIFKLYPDAKIINMVRDPRDVLLSQKKKWKRRFLGAKNIPLKEAVRARINYHPIMICKIWHSSISAAEKFSEDNRVLKINFEKLLENPEDTVLSVCNFLKIPYNKRLLNVPQVGSSNRVDEVKKIGIDSLIKEGWKSSNGLSPEEAFWCQKINGNLMERLGYAPSCVKVSPLVLLGGLLIFPFQLVLAFLFNINRMKNVFSSIIKRLQ